MNYSLKKVDEITEFTKKTFVVRIDTNVDIEKGVIVDDTRLVLSLPTINFILEKGGHIVLIGHLGRPVEQLEEAPFVISEENKKFSLYPIAQWLSQQYKAPLEPQLIHEFPGWKINGNLSLIENIRFFKGEEENDPEFSKQLAKLGDVYINEAFSVAHRKHASILGITLHLPSYAGFRFNEEVSTLTKVMNNPARPLVVLIGGAKIETKLPLVSTMLEIADTMLVGGKIATNKEELEKAKISAKRRNTALHVANLTPEGTDITPESAALFILTFKDAGTIVWNGPVGIVGGGTEEVETEKGTKELALAISNSTAYKLIGGGDTITYLKKAKIPLRTFDFVSTAGGAMLKFLSGEEMPGITPLLR